MSSQIRIQKTAINLVCYSITFYFSVTRVRSQCRSNISLQSLDRKHVLDMFATNKKCLNVRQKLGTWKFLMFSYVFQCFLTFSNVTYSQSLILTLTLSHYLTLSLFLTLTLFQSLIESLLTCWTTFVFISMLKSHSHTLTLSLSHTLSLSLSHSHLVHLWKHCFPCLAGNQL